MTINSNTTSNSVYLAFDIHHVLAEEEANATSAPLFQAYGMVLKIPVKGHVKPIRHYVYPFVKELFQLLAITADMQIAFYTSSQGVFAKPFVEQLLITTLGLAEYNKIADKICICAREQMRANDTYKDVLPSKYSSSGENRKDLDDVYPNLDVFKGQRVLIDDNASYAAPHQVKNLLNISGWQWTEKLQRYQDKGYGLYFYTSYEKFKKFQNKINLEKSIALYIKQNHENNQIVIIIVYYNDKGIQELELTVEESTYIQKLYEQSILEDITYISENHYYKDNQKAIIDEIKKINHASYLNPKDSRLILICGEGVSSRYCIKNAKRGDITIHLDKEDAHIYFPQNPKKAISLKNQDSLKLIKLARNYWELECKNEYFFIRESHKKEAKAQLYDIIWNKVNNRVLKDRIIYQANHILLLTGVIFSAWEESKITQRPISQILFNWQCKKEKGIKKFEPIILKKRRELYFKGLELLQTINPHLKPITIKSFEAALEKCPTLLEDGAEEYQEQCIVS